MSTTFEESVIHAEDVAFSANKVIRRTTSDGSDNGSISLTGGGASGTGRGGELFTYGNEHTNAGKVLVAVGNVSGSEFAVNRADGTESLSVAGSNGSTTVTSSSDSPLTINSTHASGGVVDIQKSGTNLVRVGSASALSISGAGANDGAILAPAEDLYLESGATIRSNVIQNDTTLDAANMAISGARISRSTSSRRYKTKIVDCRYGLKEILELRPRMFNDVRNPDGWTHCGFVAEDMANVMDELVGYEKLDGESLPGWIEYDYLTAPIVKAIQELHARLEQAHETIAKLTRRIEEGQLADAR